MVPQWPRATCESDIHESGDWSLRVHYNECGVTWPPSSAANNDAVPWRR